VQATYLFDIFMQQAHWLCPTVEIDRYGFFGAHTDISAIHGLIADNRYFKNF